MIKLEFFGKKIIRYLPETWDELTTDQFLHLVESLYLMQDKKFTVHDVKIRFLQYALNLKIRPPEKHHPDDYETIIENLTLLSEKVDFIFTTKKIKNKEQTVINLGFTKNHILSFRVGQKKYFGPADALHDITFVEFIKAFDYQKEFTENQNPESLHKLAAVLYRPKKWFHFIRRRLPNYDGRIQQKFNDNFIKSRAQRFQKLPPATLFGIHLFFASVLTFLTQHPKFRLLFKEEKRGGRGDDLGLTGVLFHLAGNKFGDITHTAETNLYTVLIELYLAETQRIETESKLKNK